MLQDLTQMIIQSFAKPRAGLRSVLDRVKGFEDVAVILGLSMALNAIIFVVSAMLSGTMVGVSAIMLTAAALVQTLGAFVLLTFLVLGIGKLFRGQGELLQVAAMVAWYNFITVIFAPLLLAAGPIVANGAVQMNFVHLLSVGVAVWLASNFIAEAHRFKSAVRVAGVMVGFVVAVTFLLMLFRP